MREVCKANLTCGEGGHALVQSLQLLAGAESGGNRAARHVAHRLDAGEGTDEALSVVFIGLGEPGRDHRPNQLVLVHLGPARDEIVDHLGAGLERKCPLPTFHASHYTNIRLERQVNMRTNFRKDENWPHPAADAGDLPETGEVNLSRQHLEPAGAGLTPSSQSVLTTSTPDVSSTPDASSSTRAHP